MDMDFQKVRRGHSPVAVALRRAPFDSRSCRAQLHDSCARQQAQRIVLLRERVC